MPEKYKITIHGYPPFGWYTEEEIEAESFVDFADKALKRATEENGEITAVQRIH